MDVQFIRLKTGVDIISEYELDDTGALVTLINPFVMESMLKGGHPVVFLESWLPTQVLSTNTVVMPAENIMFFAEVEDRFLMSYLQLVVKELQTKTIITLLTDLQPLQISDSNDASTSRSKGHNSGIRATVPRRWLIRDQRQIQRNKWPCFSNETLYV